ncbi:uridine diphosphate-N-acetylglucosamine-binding protein YvcK [Planosporangium flavigriseum]|uniref:Putative gluconeogenesis factor n=1 Tax=Planosporangium flavigriseum TaxID=373681 RepID=A0A8J3LTK2_9ACTN|nr:uridine diphosphate-N-acetylglucosamine-binding protein YvcK [Planosporangium flavigriseum]NJC65319.1 uridine diphosphate-N-acetylglucosamine-binding protein YvcK [Planosporangium flavigriseum]GIG73326.1 putative gluconeogenesis factor [Planosporangium flavigriseum]
MTHSDVVRVVAFGGGHGLSASLRALRLLRQQWSRCPQRRELDVTAVVTVGDDGGSSGRLRAERGGLPPGDLRQALVALADVDEPARDLSAGLFQYRFDGDGDLSGHAVGNLLLHGLMEMLGDSVAALDHAAGMLGCCGRVLPMSRQEVQIEADVLGADPTRPDEVVVVRGQHAVALTGGEVQRVRLRPAQPSACGEVLAAVEAADWLIFGPGSWFTSVIPHLLVPDLAAAVAASRAKRLVTLNLAAEKETHGLSLPDHLAALTRYLPALRVDVVLADGKAVGDPEPVNHAAESLGARLSLAPVAASDGSPRHDPAALAIALEAVLGPP